LQRDSTETVTVVIDSGVVTESGKRDDTRSFNVRISNTIDIVMLSANPKPPEQEQHIQFV
jgi:hypothetical protein